MQLKQNEAGFSIPEIKVVLATPDGSVRSQKPNKPRQPITEDKVQPVVVKHQEVAPVTAAEESQVEAPSVIISKAVEDQVETFEEAKPITYPVALLADQYPEYEPLRRLSADIREQKELEGNEADELPIVVCIPDDSTDGDADKQPVVPNQKGGGS